MCLMKTASSESKAWGYELYPQYSTNEQVSGTAPQVNLADLG
jgi:hypothetical protein